MTDIFDLTAKPPAVICDFDDTTAVENVAELLLDRFSEDTTWRELRRQARERTISLKEYQEQAFNRAGASVDEMKAEVRARATLRPHFKELWRYCNAREIPSRSSQWVWTSTWMHCWRERAWKRSLDTR